jgi:hypothetical protein
VNCNRFKLILCLKQDMTFQLLTRHAMCVWRKTEARLRNHCCSGKAVSITSFSVCACACELLRACGRSGAWACLCTCVHVALVVQHANRVRHIVKSLVTPLPPYFSTLSYKRHDFRKKKLLNIKCVFWFFLQALSKTFLILRRIERDIYINVRTYSCKVPVILVAF